MAAGGGWGKDGARNIMRILRCFGLIFIFRRCRLGGLELYP